MSTSLGPLVRLEGISVDQLPPGGKGSTATISKDAADSSSNAPAALDVKTFITNVITEAVPFIDGVAPKSGASPSSWKKSSGKGKQFPSSEAPVYFYKRIVRGKELNRIKPQLTPQSADKRRKDEIWFCRRSCHRNAAEKGTASWQEFVHSFKDRHHETEDAFTVTVIGAREAVTWDTAGLEIEAPDRWTDLTMKVVEMKHRIDPKPLRNRTFSVVQIAAMLADAQEFLVLSIAITDFKKSTDAEYAREKGLVVGAYTAMERIRVLPTSGKIEWIMATASNGKGVLPQWIQNLAVPGKIPDDVDFFMSWIPTTREATEQ